MFPPLRRSLSNRKSDHGFSLLNSLTTFLSDYINYSTPISNQEMASFDSASNPRELVSNSITGRSSFNIIRVKTGEDIEMKIMSHAQQGSQSICVISANGAISSAKLSRPDSSRGTFTFEIIVGSFFPGNMQECSKERENGILQECSRETKKQKIESTTFVAPPAVSHLPSAEMVDPSYGQSATDTMNQNLSSPSVKIAELHIHLQTDGNDTLSE